MSEGYRVGLNPDELLRVVARLLREQRRSDGLICRYLADLADALKRGPGMAMAMVYGDVHQLARYKLGLSLRSSRERLRVGKALRQLPMLRSALMAGDLPYSRVREVTRVARPDNERQWLQAARELSMRQLEQRVVAAGARGSVRVATGSPATFRAPSASGLPDAPPPGSLGPPSSPAPARESGWRNLRLPEHVWVLLEQAMREAREQSLQPLTDVQAVECVVRVALARQSKRQRRQEESPPARPATEGTARDEIQTRSDQPATQGGSSEPEPRGDWRATQSGSSEPAPREGQTAPEVATASGQEWASQGAAPQNPALSDATEPAVSDARDLGVSDASELADSDSTVVRAGRRRPLSPDARRLLELIQGDRLWNVATLSCETDMPLPRLIVALTDLEFGRWVRKDPIGFYVS